MKKIVFVLLIAFPIALQAQDKIYFADGKMEEGRVLEVDRDYILIEDQEERKTKIPRAEVSLIVYSNGKSEVFNKNYHKRSEKKPVQPKKPNKMEKLTPSIVRPNQLKLNLAAFINGTAELAYQRMMTRYMALEFPLSYGWEAGEEPYYFRKRYSFGLNILFYPLDEESIFQIYLGPGFEAGYAYFSESLLEDFYHPSGVYYQPAVTGTFSNYINIAFKLGFAFQLSKNVALGVELTPGIRQGASDINLIMPSFSYNYNLIYQF
ncbi:MAG: hypothetical protein CL840_02320 [Crocinitomicaceae bacterium]|nr:hypothetical protein [Crocinitomicaceae bacterium]|tara:strand:- start:8770 stop:9561 length:792 start_codon:yes stop_codon:yes gene_type:complete